MRVAIATALAFSLAAAQKEVNYASFGQRHSLELGYLPGWNLGGSQPPQVLTDKVIFTPPYPGEVTGSAWTTQRLNTHEFTINAKFLANGNDHAGGNLQIWYTKEGESSIQSNSLYTVDKFTGLVIAIDQHGGPGGGIRGFLNDGTISFKNHPHLDTVAFGHCDYSYRNRGLPSRLQIKHDANGLEVNIDEKLCFRTDKIVLPDNYFLGLTAASSAIPDSFEVAKFITTIPQIPSSHQRQQPNQQQQQPAAAAQKPLDNTIRSPPSDQGSGDKLTVEHIQDILASSISSSSAQFEDLHNRLQALGHNTERLFSEYMRSSAALAGRIEELHSKLARFDQLQALQGQLSSLDASVRELRAVVEGGGGDVRGMIGELHESVRERHDRLEQGLPGRIGDVVASRGPRVGLFLFVVVLMQVGVLAGYVWWKRRGDGRSKGGKYL